MTIEDAAELRLQQPHVVRLESRPASVEGRGEVTVRDLLRNALRMRPDRIVIGEVRGAEALDLLTALNTGHDGALSTVHANSAGRRARPPRDPGADGGRGAAARGDRRAGAARHRPRRPARAPRRRRAAGSPRSPRSSGSPGRPPCAPSMLGPSDERRRRAAASPGRRGRGRAARGRGARGGACQPRPGRAGCGVALEPLRRAGREGYSPSTPGAPPPRRARHRRGGRRRLVPRRRAAGAAACGRRAGPGRLGAGNARRRRYRRAVERALPDVALAVADSLSAGRSLRASLPAAASSLDGPAAVELARLGAELEPRRSRPAAAIAAWRRRMRSPRVDAFAAALLSQRLAGGDLAGLLRRFAEGAAERDRVAEDAKAATSQARFTGLLVVAMPTGGALFAELLQPGFLAKVLGVAGLGPAARARRRCSSSRASSRSAVSRRWSSESGPDRCMSAAGLLVAVAVLLALAGLRELGSGASALGARIARGGGRLAATALRLGLPARIASAGLEARLSLAAVLLGKFGGAALGGLAALAAAPAAPGRLSLLVAVGLPAAGFFVPDALLERRARLRRRRLVGALPDACDLLAVAAAAGRSPASGFAELARGGEGPLADELRMTVAELSCGRPLPAALRSLRAVSPAARSPASAPRSSARAATARRSPSSCAASRAPCAATSAARSRSAPPAPRPRSSSSSPSSSSPRSC